MFLTKSELLNVAHWLDGSFFLYFTTRLTDSRRNARVGQDELDAGLIHMESPSSVESPAPAVPVAPFTVTVTVPPSRAWASVVTSVTLFALAARVRLTPLSSLYQL